MRRLLLLLPLLALTACGDGTFSSARGPVDPATLPPMSGKEQALLAAASGAERTGETANAIRDYQGAIAQSQGHVDAHLNLAKLYLGQKQPASAQPVLERALVLQPNHPEANYLLGKIHLANNRPKEAAAAFDAGLKSAAASFDLLNGAGIAHDMLREHARAQAYYLRAISLHPEQELAMVKTNLGMSYLLSSEPKKAVEQLKDEAKKTNASPVTRHNLALAYGMLGRNGDAKPLVAKEMSEDDRKMSLERLRKYIAYEPPAAPKPNTPGGPRK